MKTWILALAMMMGITMSAQPGPGKHAGKEHKKEHKANFTAEQRTELKVKHLTLKLDLTDKQQKEMQKVVLNQEKEKEQAMVQHKANKEVGKKPTDDERYAMMSKRLDNQIAMQKEIKKILTPEQYQKFEMQREKKQEKFKKGVRKSKNHHRN